MSKVRKIPEVKGDIAPPVQEPTPEAVPELTILVREELRTNPEVESEELRAEKAVRRIVDANRRFDFTAAGYPTQQAVKREVGFDVEKVFIAKCTLAYQEEKSRAVPQAAVVIEAEDMAEAS